MDMPTRVSTAVPEETVRVPVMDLHRSIAFYPGLCRDNCGE